MYLFEKVPYLENVTFWANSYTFYCMQINFSHNQKECSYGHRTKIKTGEKAKVIASVWGQELFQLN